MKDIKEVRQALEYLKSKIDIDKKYYNYDKSVDLLDQFITDAENSIKENEELKERLYSCQDFNEKLQETNCLFKEQTNAYEKELSLHDSQAIEPSVLRKIDVLDKALDKVSKWLVDDVVDIYDKHFSPISNELDGIYHKYYNDDGKMIKGNEQEYYEDRVKLVKNYLLKESEKENV